MDFPCQKSRSRKVWNLCFFGILIASILVIDPPIANLPDVRDLPAFVSVILIGMLQEAKRKDGVRLDGFGLFRLEKGLTFFVLGKDHFYVWTLDYKKNMEKRWVCGYLGDG